MSQFLNDHVSAQHTQQISPDSNDLGQALCNDNYVAERPESIISIVVESIVSQSPLNPIWNTFGQPTQSQQLVVAAKGHDASSIRSSLFHENEIDTFHLKSQTFYHCKCV